MITCIRLDHPDTIQQFRDDYLHTLVAPMDGMWESTVIAHATFWEIQEGETPAKEARNVPILLLSLIRELKVLTR
jgi:hypothetical protein